MKTLKILAMVSCLSGCIYAGEVSLFPQRSDFVAGLKGYQIEYLDRKTEKLLETETLHQSSFKANKLLTAYKGYPIADTKSYMKNYYVQESLVAPSKALMHSSLTPAEIKAGKKYDVIGQTTIDGVDYYLISSESKTYVFLVDMNYVLQRHLGTIRNDKLILVEEKFAIDPENFKFEPVTKSRILQSDMVTGFEIKYGGVKNDAMNFTLMQYDSGGSTGEFVNYSFENAPGVVEIAGVKIKVFSADDSRLEYMIIAE